jgi:ubiquinone/menaquinone biosynthesis C-methylase UbiE
MLRAARSRSFGEVHPAEIADLSNVKGERMPESDRLILEHYRREALEHDLSPSSTMLDQTTRELEVEAILACVQHLHRAGKANTLLEVGCGNGYLLEVLRETFPEIRLCGIDYSPDMVSLASSRSVENCEIGREDVRALAFPSEAFDVVVSERCLINLLDESDQHRAIRELHRVLKPGGHLVLIEAFTDGADNLNRARAELGLPANTIPPQNLWFEKAAFSSLVETLFEEPIRNGSAELPPRNFLSSHYFVSRVLYPAVTRREVLYNTEFVRFFRFLPPQGDHSPIQLYFMRRHP